MEKSFLVNLISNPFVITVIFIVVSTVIAAFVRRVKRDKCLKDFACDMVTLREIDGDLIKGELIVANTGLEFVYSAGQTNEHGCVETSYILYKNEYANVQILIRYHDELSEAGKNQRETELKRTYHPNFFRRFGRRLLNVFKTVRDSVMEVANLLMSQAKKVAPAAGVLTSQDKYVSRMKKDLMSSAGTSYEPLLEKYIGHKVVLEMVAGDKIRKYRGVLKDYTADFIEIMDVDYIAKNADAAKKADIVVPRKHALVRHFAE
ncbi:MAG: hypothetical protein ACYTFK_03500 [Planctomycetota bacterium]|jgi:hypothetical protein